MMGDIHHYAWRARHRNQTVYINKRDSERFGDWTSEQCAVSQPVELHYLWLVTSCLVVSAVDNLAFELFYLGDLLASCLAHMLMLLAYISQGTQKCM